MLALSLSATVWCLLCLLSPSLVLDVPAPPFVFLLATSQTTKVSGALISPQTESLLLAMSPLMKPASPLPSHGRLPPLMTLIFLLSLSPKCASLGFVLPQVTPCATMDAPRAAPTTPAQVCTYLGHDTLLKSTPITALHQRWPSLHPALHWFLVLLVQNLMVGCCSCFSSGQQSLNGHQRDAWFPPARLLSH